MICLQTLFVKGRELMKKTYFFLLFLFLASLGQAATIFISAQSTGNQNYGSHLGHDFVVNQAIQINKLGAFDHGLNGIFNTITVQVWQRDNNNTGTRSDDKAMILTSMTFTAGDQGILAAGSSYRFKSLTTPIILNPGEYTITAYGFNATDYNGNYTCGNMAAPSYQNGSGLITYLGDRYGGTAGTSDFQTIGGSIWSSSPYLIFASGNIEFEAASVPETSSFLFLLACTISLLALKYQKLF